MKILQKALCLLFILFLSGCSSIKDTAQVTDAQQTADKSEKIDIAFRIKTLNWMGSFKKPIPEMTRDDIKQFNSKPYSSVVSRIVFGKSFKLSKITNSTIQGRNGDIPIRLYYPDTKPNLPVIVFFHGGGWVIGNLDLYDKLCRRIVHHTDALVISVDYRLAPFHKFPVAVEDCYDALVGISKNADQFGADIDQLTIMGDSAGGNLAAAVSLMARDMSGPSIKNQILIYPVTDASLSHPSMDRFADAPFLTKKMMVFFVNHYIRSKEDIQNPYCSPLLADDLSNLPPALIIIAQYDPLHDQGLAYGKKLLQARNAVQLTDYPKMVHGFMMFPAFCKGAVPAFNEIADFINNHNNS